MNSNTFIFFIISLSFAALIPGPGMLGIVLKTVSISSRESLKMLLGLVTADLIYLSVALYSFNLIDYYLHGVYGSVFFIFSSIYFFYIAYKLWFFKHDLSVSPPLRTYNFFKTIGMIQAYIEGLFITLSNPKTILFYLAITPSIFKDDSILTHSNIMIIYLSTGLILLSVGILYIAFALKIRERLSSPKSRIIFLRSIAIV